jgi:glucose/arabinose dehydrogenase
MMRLRHLPWAISFLASIVPGGALDAQTVDPPELRVELVVQLFATPTTMVFIGPDDLLVPQKRSGMIRRVIGGVRGPIVLDVNVSDVSERGLLGITKDPDFLHNGWIYLYYTETEGMDNGPVLGNRIYRYRWDGSALVEPLLLHAMPYSIEGNHNGGVMVFGRDDRLYAIIGDMNQNGKLQNVATGPDPDDAGAILRLDGLGNSPSDNPFYDPNDRDAPLGRVFAYGVRNSFGLTVDPVTGDVWDTENGVADMDEINHVAPGFNSGWIRIMGPDARSTGDLDDLWFAPGAVYSDPEYSWADSIGPTATEFVRSRRMGCALEHALLVGNVNCGEIYRFTLDASRQALSFTTPELQDLVADNVGAECTAEQAETLFGHGFGVVSDIENGPDGFLYVLSISTNSIYRIRPVEPVAGDTDGDLVPDACDCGPSDPGAWAEPVELPRLRPSLAGGLQLGWDDQGASAGTGTTYRVVTGSLTGLHASGGFDSACTLAAGSSIPAATDARPDPQVDDGFYYLVRAENGCADGTFGDGTGPLDPRDALDAAAPPDCD